MQSAVPWTSAASQMGPSASGYCVNHGAGELLEFMDVLDEGPLVLEGALREDEARGDRITGTEAGDPLTLFLLVIM